MNSRILRASSSVFCFGVIGACASFCLAGKSPTPSPAPPAQPLSACLAPEYHQFDFWAGDWDVSDVGSTAVNARVHVDSILDGCALREDYQDIAGTKGQSFSIYDATRKVWHQTWVTNSGRLLEIEGTLQMGEMILSGSDRTARGDERRVRGVWIPVAGGVRETAVTSMDGGKSWKPWFDLLFRPHKR